MARVFLVIAVAMAAACGPSGQTNSKPTGTPTDPVLVCERIADVCRLDDSRLGVCIQPPAGPPPESCAGRSPCFICTPQH